MTLLLLLSMGVSVSGQDVDALTVEVYRTVNVRSGPGTQFAVIDRLSSGDVVQAVGRSDVENNWLRILFGDQAGWVAFFTVTVRGDASTLPIVENEIRPLTASAQSATVGDALLAGDGDGGNVAGGGASVTAYTRVNVRTGPSVRFPRIGLLDPGDTVPITGRTDDSEWLRVTFQGQEGWVALFVVSRSGNLNTVRVVGDLPQLPPTPTIGPTQTFEERLAERRRPFLITLADTQLRAAPNFQASVVATIPDAVELEATA
ncbi:MAG: SH3 domain-containing protein, partial [Chloroflexi bacterium]|nr:SH3 domain-containing protein [Chloroflexota bacterium]